MGELSPSSIGMRFRGLITGQHRTYPQVRGGRTTPCCIVGKRRCSRVLSRYWLYPGKHTTSDPSHGLDPRTYLQEYTKRPTTSITTKSRFNRHHVANPCQLTLEECLAASDVVISAVPSANYKVKTESLRQGCVCLNISSEKNFEKDVRDKVGVF